MAEIVASNFTTSPKRAFRGADMSTKLKLMGVDVASFGNCFADENAARSGSPIWFRREPLRAPASSRDCRPR